VQEGRYKQAMTPAARLQAAIEILGQDTSQPLERQLKAWFRARRFAGSSDRRAIAERLYAIYRQRAHFAHRMESDAPRALAIASLLAEGEDPVGYFTGGYGPEPLTEAERAQIAAPPKSPTPHMEGEYPNWLEGELRRAFGPRLPEEMAAFQQRAPVDVRVNSLKAARDDVLARLREDGIEAVALPDLPLAIRCPPNSPLTAHPLFVEGAFEIQDAAAQAAVLFCEAKPGMRVLDLAAGAGGKALALAAAMENKGEVIACDVRTEALTELERRARRAGAHIIRSQLLGTPPEGPFDLVLVDAPCSGSGTWRRQPELKWRLTPERLAERIALQDQLLDQAAGRGERLVYATCSILPCENEDRTAAFLARHPYFTRKRDYCASPARSGTDGFYAALLADAHWTHG
jgi:16S rRNA (cytosine967-C5)-methyltransferase